MTASPPFLSTGALAGLGPSSNGANAGAAATTAPRGQAADASSAGSGDSFRKLLGQGASAQGRSDAQAKGKTAHQARDNQASQDNRPAEDAQARGPASANAAGSPASSTPKTAKSDADKDSAANDGDAGSPDAAQAVWVAGLPLPGLPATPTAAGSALPSAVADDTATPASPTGPQATPAAAGGALLPAVADNTAMQALPPGLQTATASATQLNGAAVNTDGTAADMPTPFVTASLPQAMAATTLARSSAQALSANAPQTDAVAAGKAASATLAAIAPALVQPLQGGDAGKNADGIDLAALGLVATGTAPAQATLQAATAVFPPTLPPADLDAGQFDRAIGARLTWMADQKIGHANIKVSPEGMGQIEVQMKLDGNRVHAEFNASQPEVRHALESSLPRLREMLDQQGFQLAQANVGQGQRQFSDARQSSAESGNQEGALARPGNAGAGVTSTTMALPAHGLGLLDTYA